MGFSVSETAAGQLPLSRSCAARRPIIHPPSERMWCTPPLDAPRGADFSPSHGHDLDFLWSGRRDSNRDPHLGKVIWHNSATSHFIHSSMFYWAFDLP
jgi:hypothetical protein